MNNFCHVTKGLVSGKVDSGVHSEQSWVARLFSRVARLGLGSTDSFVDGTDHWAE